MLAVRGMYGSPPLGEVCAVKEVKRLGRAGKLGAGRLTLLIKNGLS